MTEDPTLPDSSEDLLAGNPDRVYSTTECRGPGKLLLVPTPLGNLGDVTERAAEALRQADLVCCEDTRVTGKLLAALGIEGKPLERMDEASIGRKAAPLMEQIVHDGSVVAFCSDAGMPGISDPGQRLVEAAYAAAVDVEVLPGGTAVATAYAASGFTCPRFYFGGFAPRKDGERMRAFEAVRDLDAALVFYDSPHRVADTLRKVAVAFPTRLVSVSRELTKLHAETVRGSAPDVAAFFARRKERDEMRGEFVLVIDAPSQAEEQEQALSAIEAARALIAEEKEAGTLTNKDLVKAVCEVFGLSRNDAYALVNEE